MIEQDYFRRIVLREHDSVAHQGESHVFYLDVSFDETARRHATRPLASEVTPEQMLLVRAVIPLPLLHFPM